LNRKGECILSIHERVDTTYLELGDWCASQRDEVYRLTNLEVAQACAIRAHAEPIVGINPDWEVEDFSEKRGAGLLKMVPKRQGRVDPMVRWYTTESKKNQWSKIRGNAW
jgi:hypothetical protein